MARKSDRWTVAEIRIFVPDLTVEGRDAIVRWLKDRAFKIEQSKCDYHSFNQPDRLHKLKVGR